MSYLNLPSLIAVLPTAFVPPPLFAADFGDVIKIVVAILFFVFWIAGQIISEKQKAKGKAPPRQPQRPPGGQPPVRPRQAAPDPIADEIEEFLRRATGHRKRGEVEGVEVLVPEPHEDVRPEPRRLVESAVVRPTVVIPQTETQSPRRLVSRPASGAIDRSAELGKGVGAHVTEHISVSSFQERTSRLGDEVALADDKLESHLHQKFDHSVSRLAHREIGPGVSSRREASPLAESVARMFQSAETVRQVVILNELFRRPEDRW